MSLKVVPFKSLSAVSYSPSTVTMAEGRNLFSHLIRRVA